MIYWITTANTDGYQVSHPAWDSLAHLARTYHLNHETDPCFGFHWFITSDETPEEARERLYRQTRRADEAVHGVSGSAGTRIAENSPAALMGRSGDGS